MWGEFHRSKLKSFGSLAAVCAAMGASVTGCSLDMFRNSTDDSGLKLPSYNEISLDCSNLNLSSAVMDGPTFVGLIKCFNSNGSIQEIAELVTSLNRDEVDAVVAVLNEHLLSRPERLYELEHTFNTLSERKKLQEAFASVGRLLEFNDFLISAVAVLRNGYLDRSPDHQEKLLISLELLSEKLSNENARDALDYGLSASYSQSVQGLLQKFQDEAGGWRPLELTLAQAFLYFKDDSDDPKHIAIVREVMEALRNQSLFRVLNETSVLGKSVSELQSNIPELAGVMTVLGREGHSEWKPSGGGGAATDAALFTDATSLMSYMNGPVTCLKGSKVIDDAAMKLITQITDNQNTEDAPWFIKKTNPLILVSMNSLCDFPAELGMYYRGLSRFADTTVIEKSIDFLKAMRRENLLDFLVDTLADTGSLGSERDQVGVKRVRHLLAEVTERRAWEEILLVGSLPTVTDQRTIADFMGFLMQNRSELSGGSIYDVLSDAVVRNNPVDLIRLARSAKAFVDLEDDDYLFRAAFRAAREVFYANEVHPLLDMSREVMGEARKHRKLFELVFRLSEDGRSQLLSRALAKTAEMAKKGTLRELVGAYVNLFSKYAQTGAKEIKKLSTPEEVYKFRHNLSKADLAILPPIGPGGDTACTLLDTRILMGDPSVDGWDAQVENMVNCLNIDGQHEDVARAIQFLKESKTSGGVDFLKFQINLINGLNLSGPEMGDLVDRWLETVGSGGSGDFFKLMDLVPLVVTRSYGGKAPEYSDVVSGPVLYPLLKILAPILPASHEQSNSLTQFALRELNDFGSEIIARDNIPKILRYMEALATRPDSEVTPTEPDHPNEFDHEQLADSIEQVECRKDTEEQYLRVQEVIDDYRYAVTSWDVDRETGVPQRSWTKEELRATLEPVFQKFADPAQSHPEKHVLDGVIGMMNYFSRDPQKEPQPGKPYTKEDLTSWLHDRSNDYRVMPYLYPGDTQPRLRLVSTLDRLELVLVNSDFVFLPLGKTGLPGALHWIVDKLGGDTVIENSAVKYLQMMAKAWGDEPMESWPPEIQEEYQRTGKPPLKLREAFTLMKKELKDMTSLAGVPKVENCLSEESSITYPKRGPLAGVLESLPIVGHYIRRAQVSLFNLNQLLPVIEENLPLEPGENPELKPLAGGMKVLRNTFWELLSSTPVQNRNAKDHWKNNLSVVTKLSRFGFLHMAGQGIRYFEKDDPALQAFIDSLVMGATAKGPDDILLMGELLKVLFASDKDHRLVWGLIDEIHDGMNSKEDRAYIRQLGFYLLGEAANADIIDSALLSMNPVIHHYYDYLSANTDGVSDVLTWKPLSKAAKALSQYKHQSEPEAKDEFFDLMDETFRRPELGLDLFMLLSTIHNDPEAHQAWRMFWGRFLTLKDSPELDAIPIEKTAKALLHFLQEEPVHGDLQSARKVRLFLSKMMASKDDGFVPSDLEEFLLLMRRNPGSAGNSEDASTWFAGEPPAGFYQMLEAVSRHIENGDLKDLVGFMRDMLPPPGKKNGR